MFDAHRVSNNLLICVNYAVKIFVKGQNEIRKKYKSIVFLIVETNTRQKTQTLRFENGNGMNSRLTFFCW